MIYLDHAATSPALPEVFASMEPFYKERFGNASSAHAMGRQAREAVENARKEVAALIGALPSEIVFTSGGTESDNQALFGAFHHAMEVTGRFCLITTAFEHEAVLETAHALEGLGAEVMVLLPDSEGYISSEQVWNALGAARSRGYLKEELLVSVMFANNELGTIQPVREIGEMCRKAGILFHTDAVQAVGHVPLDVNALSVDLLSASAHKFGGPQGVGFLYVRQGTGLSPFLYGGGQENGLRSGTYNTPGIVGMGVAAKCSRERLSEQKKVSELRDGFRAGILQEIPDVHVNGPVCASDERPLLPGHLNVRFDGVESSSLLLMLDSKGICASGGSACAAMKEEPSHVLRSIGLSEEEADSSVRFTFGLENTKEETDEALRILKDCVETLRKLRFG